MKDDSLGDDIDEAREADGPLDPVAEARRGLAPDAKVCGHCLIWKPNRQEASGRWVGPCRLMPGRGDLPPTAASCDRFLPRGKPIPSAAPPEVTRRRSRTITGPTLRRAGAVVAPGAAIAVTAPKPDVDLGEFFDMTRNELTEILREALADAMGDGDTPPLAGKWEGGNVVLKPANPELQARELPIDSIFRKVVMIRDRLRVLEAKLNAHPKLSDGEKIEMQSYITKCYGSLTTFNVLFRDKDDHFVGEKG